MRRTLCLLLSFCLFAFLAVGAAADVIWEPYGDSFYDTHRDEMEYENRYYKATTALAQYDKPNGKITEENVIKANELFNVQYVYEDEDGKLWGNCYVPGKDSVWALLDGCLLPYDREAFAADYSDTFVAISDQPDISFYAEDVPVYDYPGAATSLYNMIVDEGSEYLPEYVHTYTDEAGNIWGELMYFRGMSGWVLLEGDRASIKAPALERDFPIGTTMPEQTESADTPALTDPAETEPAAEQDTEAAENTEADTTDVPETPVAKKNYTLPILLVAAVVVLTVGVLLAFFGKKKK